MGNWNLDCVPIRRMVKAHWLGVVYACGLWYNDVKFIRGTNGGLKKGNIKGNIKGRR